MSLLLLQQVTGVMTILCCVCDVWPCWLRLRWLRCMVSSPPQLCSPLLSSMMTPVHGRSRVVSISQLCNSPMPTSHSPPSIISTIWLKVNPRDKTFQYVCLIEYLLLLLGYCYCCPSKPWLNLPHLMKAKSFHSFYIISSAYFIIWKGILLCYACWKK